MAPSCLFRFLLPFGSEDESSAARLFKGMVAKKAPVLATSMEKSEVKHLDTACEQIGMGKALDTPILNQGQEIYWAIATFSSHTCGLRGSGGCGVLWLGLHGFPYLSHHDSRKLVNSQTEEQTSYHIESIQSLPRFE